MKKLRLILILVSMTSVILPVVAFAQEDDDNTIILGIYYRCNQAKESRADEFYNQIVAPVAQKHVDLGT